MSDREALMRALSYDPETGVFRWNEKRKNIVPGEVAGGLDKDGYWLIQVNGKNYRAHRLAWFFVHGEWPASLLDHKNRIKSDNRIDNLRLSSKFQNAFNVSPERNNSSGVMGVSWCAQTGRWKAQINVGKKTLNLGRYKTIELAREARVDAERRYAGEFSPAQNCMA